MPQPRELANRTSQVTCLAGCGAINATKLKGYCLVSKPNAIRYDRATINSVLGMLLGERGNLQMVKIPIVIRESLGVAYTKYIEGLRDLP